MRRATRFRHARAARGAFLARDVGAGRVPLVLATRLLAIDGAHAQLAHGALATRSLVRGTALAGSTWTQARTLDGGHVGAGPVPLIGTTRLLSGCTADTGGTGRYVAACSVVPAATVATRGRRRRARTTSRRGVGRARTTRGAFVDVLGNVDTGAVPLRAAAEVAAVRIGTDTCLTRSAAASRSGVHAAAITTGRRGRRLSLCRRAQRDRDQARKYQQQRANRSDPGPRQRHRHDWLLLHGNAKQQEKRACSKATDVRPDPASSHRSDIPGAFATFSPSRPQFVEC